MDCFGVQLDAVSLQLCIVLGASVLSFVAIFCLLACTTRNEIVLTRRCIAWSRLATVCLAVCYSLTLALELEHPQPIVAPSFGIARAVVGIVVCYIAFFVSSHQAMRWAVLVSQLPLIASDVFYAPVLRILVDCRANGSCLASTGFNITELRRYEALQHVSAFFSTWLLLIASYLLISMGACTTRYHVSNFSTLHQMREAADAAAAATLKKGTHDGRPKLD